MSSLNVPQQKTQTLHGDSEGAASIPLLLCIGASSGVNSWALSTPRKEWEGELATAHPQPCPGDRSLLEAPLVWERAGIPLDYRLCLLLGQLGLLVSKDLQVREELTILAEGLHLTTVAR